MAKLLKQKIIKLFNEGKSYDEISKIVRCAKSTISYHCNKLRYNKFSEENIKKYQDYYNQGFSLKEVGIEFNVSRQTLGRYIKVRKLTKLQSEQKSQVRKKDYRVRVKQKAVDYKGGKCEICGYSKSISALEFHHKNSNKKDFGISGGTKSFESIKNELDKCILVCANCHREIHANLHPDIYPCTDTA
jgi:predicted DNA-binding protein YlxM (UPF0122 family)